AWQGQRVLLRFNGVKYNSVVFVNDKRVGGCFNGYDLFVVDATDAVKFGAANKLLVGARDWSGVFERPMPGEPPQEFHALRSWPKDNVLSPIGGRYADYGIWDDVTLLAVPLVRVSDITIVPSLRKHTLSATLELANDTKSSAEVTLKNTVAGESSVAFKDVVLTLAAGQRTNLTVSARWEKPKLWDYEHPELCHLETRLEASGATADVLRTRFGFREFWVERGQFVLNGVPLVLRASSTWPVGAGERDDIVAICRKLKEAHTIAFRTHTQPWRQLFYDAADEAGLLMIPEGAIWNDRESYRVDDERFWQNYRDHLRAMWQRLKNNPSVVMWSLENEFYGGRCLAGSRGEAEMAKAGQFLKRLDPTRPITYESDGDPRLKPADKIGVADVIGMHYPHEYPDFRLYPDTCYWLNHTRIHRFFWPTDRFRWSRSKPLYIGEFLWLPSSSPNWHTVWFGDDAYINYHDYRNRGKGESWRDQIIAYRAQGVNGICPWTMFEGGPLNESNHLWRAHVHAFHPVGAYLREADTRFYAGEKVSRTVTVFNDTLRDNRVEFQWMLLSASSNTIAGRVHDLFPKHGQPVTQSWLLSVPSVKARTNVTLVLKSSTESVAPFEEKRTVSFWPRPKVTVGQGVAIYGVTPQTDVPPSLQSFRVLKDLSQLNPASVRVLIVLPGALDSLAEENAPPVIGERKAKRDLLENWVRGGGRALICSQGPAANRLLPTPFLPQTSTMTFAQDPQHPALAGIGAADLKFWRGDGKIVDVLVEQLPPPSAETPVAAPAPKVAPKAAKPPVRKPKRSPRKAGLIERAQGQHIVTSAEPAWDARAGVHPIVVAGNAGGLTTAPLCEARRGEGVMLLCGLQLIEKLETEPAARTILQNCLNYLSAYDRMAGEVTCYAPEKSEIVRILRGIGVQLSVQPLANAPSARSRVVVFDGDIVAKASADQLRGWLHAGATVWLHRPSAQVFENTAKALGLNAALTTAHGPIRRADTLPPIASGLAREDLYWLGPPRGYAETIPQARDSIATAVKAGGSFTLLAEPGGLGVAKVENGVLLVDTFDEASPAARRNSARLARLFSTLLVNAGADFIGSAGAMSLPAGQFEPVGTFPYFERGPDGLYMGTNGKIMATVRVAQAGAYVLSLVGDGTPAQGQFPIMEVALDGRKLGRVELASLTPAAHSLEVELPAGQHELSLEFVNDLFAGGEDRNLRLHAVE
ncbi:MAG: hypothetical protein FJ388_08855, partial [Verrucomicrobia bacterium]|nr:hypothetical protein [Verrucomicrobiota bacterium]